MLSKRGARYLEATRARRAKAASARRAAGPVSISTMARFSRSGTELKTQLQPLPAGFNSVGSTWVESDLLSTLAQGDDIGQRNGRRIFVRGLEIRGVIAGAQSNIATDDAYNNMRIVVARYTGTAGSLAPLGSSGGGVTLASPVIPGYGQNCLQVLYDKTHVLQAPGRDSVGYVATAKAISIKLRLNVLCTFQGTGAVTNNDHIVVSCISDSVLAPNPGWTYYSAALHFTD